MTATPQTGPSRDKLIAHDVIYQIDDIGVVDAEQAMRVIAAGEPSRTLVFHVLREGAKVMVPITLGQGWQEKDTPSAEYFDGYLGMDLEMWDTKEGVESGVKTPVITKVHSLGPAHKAQIASSQRSIVVRGPYGHALRVGCQDSDRCRVWR